MGFFDLRARIKFTTDCVRYNSAHFIAMWWVNEDGSVWTDKSNPNNPYLWLVRKGLNNNYNLREATNFDINLDVQNIFTPSYNCRVHTQCNNHKLRIMIIPVCKVPNLNTYNQFETAFNDNTGSVGSDGDYVITRLDNNAAYSGSYSTFSNVLNNYINNSLTNRSFGESIIDIDVVNSIMKNCINKTYRFGFLSSIITGNNLNFYTICGSKLSGSGNLIVPSYQLFPNPVDNGNPINDLDLGTSSLHLRFCHRSLNTTGDIHEYSLNVLDSQQYPLVDCCNTYEFFNVSVTTNAAQSFKYFIFYQDADPTSPTFLQFVNKVIRDNDTNYNNTINGIVAIPGSLYVVQYISNTPPTGSVVYQSAMSNKNFSITIPNGTGSDTLTVTKGGINKIQCP
jgi:hypothetical protein